ncbi:hypothetical protein GCM10007862_27970 [Dyella lipolytica]|nr:hypothetical protein GCM10007862_27970 [Dyella lipolytica]
MMYSANRLSGINTRVFAMGGGNVATGVADESVMKKPMTVWAEWLVIPTCVDITAQ